MKAEHDSSVPHRAVITTEVCQFYHTYCTARAVTAKTLANTVKTYMYTTNIVVMTTIQLNIIIIYITERIIVNTAHRVIERVCCVFSYLFTGPKTQLAARAERSALHLSIVLVRK